jgi:hypothetical protein
VTIQSTMTALNDGSLDLGAAVDDELTASMVQTLTGGGLADSLHNHTADGGGAASGGGGGGCVTLYGQDSCPDGFSEVLAGETVILGSIHSNSNGGAGFGGPACMDTDALGSIDGNNGIGDNRVHSMGWDADYWAMDDLPCTICCGGGGGGAVSSTANGISFKGITTTTQIGDAGLAQMNADCHAEFENSRMCRMHDLMEMYPAPVPGVEGRVLNIFATGMTQSGQGAQMVDGGVAKESAQYSSNCAYLENNDRTNPFSSTNYHTTLIDADGNFSNNMCVNPYPTACCGP